MIRAESQFSAVFTVHVETILLQRAPLSGRDTLASSKDITSKEPEEQQRCSGSAANYRRRSGGNSLIGFGL